MSKLKEFREKFNLTQEELTEKSGISVRTIQRIEAGTEPKGQTLKILAKTLGIEEHELLNKELHEEKLISREKPALPNYSFLKLINLSSLPLTFLPPVNILLPLILMLITKQKNPITKQIITVQIMWTISAGIIFMITAFMKNWFSLGNKFSMIVMILLVLSNVFIILRNTAEIDINKQLYFKLNFSII